MALFVVVSIDKPDSLDVRMANRPAHLDYLSANAAAVKAGGPFLDDDGGMIGSMLVLDVDSKADAEALAAKDPYRTAGLFASVDVRAWRWTVGAPA